MRLSLSHGERVASEREPGEGIKNILMLSLSKHEDRGTRTALRLNDALPGKGGATQPSSPFDKLSMRMRSVDTLETPRGEAL